MENQTKVQQMEQEYNLECAFIGQAVFRALADIGPRVERIKRLQGEFKMITGAGIAPGLQGAAVEAISPIKSDSTNE